MNTSPYLPEPKGYPGIGLLFCLTSGLLFWGGLYYLISH